VATVIEIAGGDAFDAGQLDGVTEQAGTLHADADDAEAETVARAVDCIGSGMCSGLKKIAGEAASAPAAPAVRWRNWRRDRSFFMVRSSRKLAVDGFQSTSQKQDKE